MKPRLILVMWLLALPAVLRAQDPILPPLPPHTFQVNGVRDGIHLSWTSQAGTPDPQAWELYRTTDAVDHLPYTRIATFPGSQRSYVDSAFVVNTAYFYYLVAVGEPQVIDPTGLHGTPDGGPLRSPRYATQTDLPTAVGFRPGLDGDSLLVVGPNPFRTEARIRYLANGPALVRLSIFNTLGQEVRVLLDDVVMTYAAAEVPWDGEDSTGRQVPSGVYYVQLSVGARYRKALPMVFVR